MIWFLVKILDTWLVMFNKQLLYYTARAVQYSSVLYKTVQIFGTDTVPYSRAVRYSTVHVWYRYCTAQPQLYNTVLLLYRIVHYFYSAVLALVTSLAVHYWLGTCHFWLTHAVFPVTAVRTAPIWSWESGPAGELGCCRPAWSWQIARWRPR